MNAIKLWGIFLGVVVIKFTFLYGYSSMLHVVFGMLILPIYLAFCVSRTEFLNNRKLSLLIGIFILSSIEIISMGIYSINTDTNAFLDLEARAVAISALIVESTVFCIVIFKVKRLV